MFTVPNIRKCVFCLMHTCVVHTPHTHMYTHTLTHTPHTYHIHTLTTHISHTHTYHTHITHRKDFMLRNLVDLCYSLNCFPSILVWDHSFVPREYLVSHLEDLLMKWVLLPMPLSPPHALIHLLSVQSNLPPPHPSHLGT